MKTYKYFVKEAHCASCAILIEQAVTKSFPTVKKITLNYQSGELTIRVKSNISVEKLTKVLKKENYTLLTKKPSEKKPKWSIVLFISALLIGAYYLLQQYDIMPHFDPNVNMPLSVILTIGIVAAFSTCAVIIGSLLVAVTTKYEQSIPNATIYDKIRAHVSFNIGRLVSFTLFGFLLGLIGSYIMLSIKMSGFLTFLVSIILLILGLQFIGFSFASIPIPKFIGKKIMHKQTTHKSQSIFTPFAYGGLSFFLPCGFTIALQLYVLARGDAIFGAITLFVFAIGTLPALVLIGGISSVMKGIYYKYFVKVAGVFLVFVAVLLIPGALSLMDIQLPQSTQEQGELPQIIDGVQTVDMTIKGLDYYPSQITVHAGVPIVWNFDIRQAVGCATYLVIPKLDFQQFLIGNTTVNLIIDEPGVYNFMCGMAMTTRGAAITVIAGETI